MKLNTCFWRRAVILVMFFSFALCVAAQNLTLQMDKKPLSDVLTAITKSTGYKFVYSSAMQNQLKTIVSLDCTNEKLDAVLGKLFKDKGISFKIDGKNIALAPESMSSTKAAQSKDNFIRGTILDENGAPLVGTAVFNKRTNSSDISDINGNFRIAAQQGDFLEFSFLGYKDKQSIVGKESVINIQMEVDATYIENVVVTGYQTISKERATGSFDIVKTEQLSKPSSNIASRLVGTSAGVQATTDAEGNVSFEIRGQTSLYANAQPLLVVDGFAVQGDFNSINPNDVESVSILKDAAAASIWGAKSANGVIVVTTKSGKNNKKGEVKVDVNAFWKVSPKIDISYLNPRASSAETIEFEKKAWNNGQGFMGSGYWLPNEDTYQDYYAMSLAFTAMNENRLGYLSEADLQKRLDYLSKLDNSQQIKDHILDNPFTHQYNVNISGSSERANHALSLMYENSNGYYQGKDKDRYNVAYRTNVSLFKWLDFNFSGNFNVTDTRDNSIVWTGYSPYEMLYNQDGSLADVGDYYMPNIKRHVPTELFPYTDWTYNPISEREGRNFRTKSNNYRVQGGLTAKIIKGLTFESKFQYEKIESFTKNIYDESTNTVRDYVNTTSTWDQASGSVKPNLASGGFMDQSKAEIDSYNWRNQINFNRDFDGKKHQINFIAGTEVSDIVAQNTTFARTYGYNDNTLTVGKFLNGVGGSGALKITNWQGSNLTYNYTNSFTYNTERYFSLYANLAYTLLEKYTLSASARADASNLITDDPAYRYSPFWSVGAAWNATKEEFMKDIHWLDRLNVRATFGYNGNVDRSTSFMPLISVTAAQNQYIQDYTANISSYGNPTLRWEKTGSLDLGIDFSALKNKLYGKIDFYNKKGKDLIVSMTIPSVNGTTSQKLNAAKMTNRGIELELGTTLKISGNDIVWNGSMNFSYNFNRIDDLFKATYAQYDLYDGGTSSYVQGHNANTLWRFKYAGVRNLGTESNPLMRPVVQGTGDSVFPFTAWTTGNAVDFMLDMGTTVAPYTLGLSSSFKIYDFDLSFILTGKFGHVFGGFSFNYPSAAGAYGDPNRLYSEVMNADPNKMAPLPFDGEERLYFWDRFYPYLDYLTQRAGHVRLQELNLTYNLPSNFSKAISLNAVKAFVQCNNLFTIVNNKYNEDPEFPIGSLKPQPTVTMGLNISF